MQVRRSIAGLERVQSYQRRASRKWYLYGVYSSAIVEQCLTIYHTYFNYIAKGEGSYDASDASRSRQGTGALRGGHLFPVSEERPS